MKGGRKKERKEDEGRKKVELSPTEHLKKGKEGNEGRRKMKEGRKMKGERKE